MDYSIIIYYQILSLLLFSFHSPAYVGAIPTQSQSKTLNGLAAMYKRSTDPPKAIRGTDLKLTSGWMFLAPFHGYWVNAVTLWPASLDKYIVVDGIRTINTQCLTVYETTWIEDGPNSRQLNWLEDPHVIPANELIQFQTANGAAPPQVEDHCCLDYFSNIDCGASGPKRTLCPGTELTLNAGIDIRSFKVYNCIGKWVEGL